jgi:hypothetical protein
MPKKHSRKHSRKGSKKHSRKGSKKHSRKGSKKHSRKGSKKHSKKRSMRNYAPSLLDDCYNQEDPITGNTLSDLPDLFRNNLTRLPEGNKYHCFETGPLLKWVKKNQTNPVTRKQLTKSEINFINQRFTEITEKLIYNISILMDDLLDHSESKKHYNELFDDNVWHEYINMLYEDKAQITMVKFLYNDAKLSYQAALEEKSSLWTNLNSYNLRAQTAYNSLVLLETRIKQIIGLPISEPTQWEPKTSRFF